jgi:hypothetical protein
MHYTFLLEAFGILVLIASGFALGYVVGRIKGQDLGKQRFVDELPTKW